MLSRAKFQLKASVQLAQVAALVWVLLGFCGLGIMGWSWLGLAYAALAGLVVGGWVWRYAWLRSSTSVVAMSWTLDEFCCYLRNGDQVSGAIRAKSAFNPYFITLHITAVDGTKFWWPLMADSGPADVLRKLRVFGRWHQQEPIANQN